MAEKGAGLLTDIWIDDLLLGQDPVSELHEDPCLLQREGPRGQHVVFDGHLVSLHRNEDSVMTDAGIRGERRMTTENGILWMLALCELFSPAAAKKCFSPVLICFSSLVGCSVLIRLLKQTDS